MFNSDALSNYMKNTKSRTQSTNYGLRIYTEGNSTSRISNSNKQYHHWNNLEKEELINLLLEKEQAIKILVNEKKELKSEMKKISNTLENLMKSNKDLSRQLNKKLRTVSYEGARISGSNNFNFSHKDNTIDSTQITENNLLTIPIIKTTNNSLNPIHSIQKSDKRICLTDRNSYVSSDNNYNNDVLDSKVKTSNHINYTTNKNINFSNLFLNSNHSRTIKMKNEDLPFTNNGSYNMPSPKPFNINMKLISVPIKFNTPNNNLNSKTYSLSSFGNDPKCNLNDIRKTINFNSLCEPKDKNRHISNLNKEDITAKYSQKDYKVILESIKNRTETILNKYKGFI